MFVEIISSVAVLGLLVLFFRNRKRKKPGEPAVITPIVPGGIVIGNRTYIHRYDGYPINVIGVNGDSLPILITFTIDGIDDPQVYPLRTFLLEFKRSN